MNKAELISAMSEKAELSKADTAKAIDAFVSVVSDALKTGDEVRIVGFGSFGVSDRAASKGRNPRTGEEIDIPASKQVRFKVGRSLKDELNG